VLVYRDLGLPIAIGIAASKAQAKLANRLAKAMPAHAGVFQPDDLCQLKMPGWTPSPSRTCGAIGRCLAR